VQKLGFNTKAFKKMGVRELSFEWRAMSYEL
jgi:hypothetical protein